MACAPPAASHTLIPFTDVRLFGRQAAGRSWLPAAPLAAPATLLAAAAQAAGLHSPHKTMQPHVKTSG